MNYANCEIEQDKRTAKLLKLRISNGTIRIVAACPDTNLRWKGFVIAYKHKIEEDKEAHFIAADKMKISGTNAILSLDIAVKDIPFRRTHWSVLAVYEENDILYGMRLKEEKKKGVHRAVRFLHGNSYVTGDGNILFPYYTKGGIVSLRYREHGRYDGIGTRIKECIAVLYYLLFKKRLKQKKIFIIHEKRCNKAQDNAYYLFKHCMENDEEKRIGREIYFVIESDSPDYKKVSEYGDNVLKFMSIKHMVYLLACRLLLSSDSRAHAYAWQNMESLIAPCVKNKKHVFLQHGVLALKRLNSSFSSKNMASDLVTVTSKMEGDIVKKYLGYSKNCVAETGYARFDALKDKSEGYNEILLMPTFRSWLFGVERSVFVASEYYKNYMDILNSERLISLLEKNNTVLKFYLHPSIGEHIDAFTSYSNSVQVIKYGEISLDELMMRCKALITDYSSVTWDVYYMGKPTLFYQYDVDIYQETWGSYIDLEKELPGDRTESIDGLISLVEENINSGFNLKHEYEQNRLEHYRFLDQNNSKRICDEIAKRGW